MKREEEVRQRFEREVAEHALTVEHDHGLYRHLRFAKPGTSFGSFSIVTWPGSLCVDGDMGTYTFSRIEDMFEFFRRPKGDLEISSVYWHQKVTAADTSGELREYDADLFRRRIADRRDDAQASADLRRAVEVEVLPHAEDGESAAIAAADGFEHYDGEGGVFTFSDFGEVNLRVYSEHFLWCLYAIVWGIRQWDAQLERENEIVDEDRP